MEPVASKPNGCGAQDSIFNPPDFDFKDACDDHDVAYSAGGTRKDRRKVDANFRRAMVKRAIQEPWYKTLYLYPFAYLYWAGVRLGGWRRWGKE